LSPRLAAGCSDRRQASATNTASRTQALGELSPGDRQAHDGFPNSHKQA